MSITLDDIVEKYRSFGSEATITANLRRQGVSAADIERIVANHRARVPTPSEREAHRSRVEGFRHEIATLSRAEQIARYLGLFSSHERAIPLLESTIDEPADVFWQVFLENWNACDGLWQLRKILLDTLRRRKAQRSPIAFLNAEDRRFYDGLPDVVTVYRGCGRRRVRGLPWTTDRKIAAYFARGGRFPAPPDPVIACATIAKVDLFFVSTDRNESEVILDPYSIKRLKLHYKL
jgi:hypothetical protein